MSRLDVARRDFVISGGVLTANENELVANGYAAGPVLDRTMANGARIGVGAKLMVGTQIGRAATIAAGAVATPDVAPGEFVMEIPARDGHRGGGAQLWI